MPDRGPTPDPETLGPPEVRELLDGLQTAIDAIHAQARGHHNVVGMEKIIVADVKTLLIETSSLSAQVADMRVDVGKLVAVHEVRAKLEEQELEEHIKTGEIERQTKQVDLDTKKAISTAVTDSIRAGATVVGEFFRSRWMVGLYGFLGYAAMMKLATWLSVPIPSFLMAPPTPMTTGPLVVLPPTPIGPAVATPEPAPAPAPDDGTQE